MVKELFNNANTFIFAITTSYFGAFLLHFWLKRRTGNLRRIQKAAIYGITKRLNQPELIEAIYAIIEEDPKILMPAKRTNIVLLVISTCLLIWTFPAIFYKGLYNIIGPLPLGEDIVYIVFSVLTAIGGTFLFFEYRYWVDFNRLKSEYPGNNNNIYIKIKVECRETLEVK